MAKSLKILIVDTNREAASFGSKNLVHWAIKMSEPGSEVMVRRAPEQDLRLGLEPDAIVLSGSVTSCLEATESWIKPYDDFVTHHIKKGTPILGVCYGHQALARCIARMNDQESTLRKAQDAELGWAAVQITKKTRLLEGLEKSFITYESHYEEVAELPAGTFGFAQTDRCAIQGFEMIDRPIFGIQFHPEYSIEEAEASLSAKLKKGVRKDWILNQGKGSKLYDEKVGKVIFGNFFKLATRD
jgi:GMP synthase-like glutamine amidotransferase